MLPIIHPYISTFNTRSNHYQKDFSKKGRARSYMQFCLSLLSKNVITAGEFLNIFTDVLGGQHIDNNPTTPSNSSKINPIDEVKGSVIWHLSRLTLERTSEKINFDKFELNGSENIWDLLAKLVLLILLINIYAEQQDEILELSSDITNRLCTMSFSSLSLNLTYDTLKRLIFNFGDRLDNCFEAITAMLKNTLFFGKTWRDIDSVHDMRFDTVQRGFSVARQLLASFPNRSPEITEFLSEYIESSENPNTFATQFITNFQSSPQRSKQIKYFEEGKETLERLLIGEFWRTVEMSDSDLSETLMRHEGELVLKKWGRNSNDRETCGLTNMGSTCYFNSLVQQFLNMDWFVKFVLDNCAKLKREAFITGISNGWDIALFNIILTNYLKLCFASGAERFINK